MISKQWGLAPLCVKDEGFAGSRDKISDKGISCWRQSMQNVVYLKLGKGKLKLMSDIWELRL